MDADFFGWNFRDESPFGRRAIKQRQFKSGRVMCRFRVRLPSICIRGLCFRSIMTSRVPPRIACTHSSKG